MAARQVQQKRIYTCGLYRVVFESRYTKVAIGVLFAAFLVQPVAPAYAGETEQEDIEPAVSDVIETTEVDREEVVVEETVVETAETVQQDANKEASALVEDGEDFYKPAEINANSGAVNVDEVEVIEKMPVQKNGIEEVNASSSSMIVEDGGDVFGTSTTIKASTSGQRGGAESGDTATSSSHTSGTGESVATNKSTTTATSTETYLQDAGVEVNGQDGEVTIGRQESDTFDSQNTLHTDRTGSSTSEGVPALSDSETSSSTASSTGETDTGGAVVFLQSQIQNDESYYHFSKDECVLVDDGSFYCGEKAETNSHEMEDGLIAAPDSDGDLEIYLIRNGEQVQITNNLVDDAAPYYDAESDTIVFHRLIHDRYQIVSYNLDTGTETQLTEGHENNMEPARFGTHTVWQKWNVNNWDIMLYDGHTTTKLSSSKEHDVAPQIHENLVLWNTVRDGEPHVAMYDLETGVETIIPDADAAAVLNPRIMLVYDSAQENGDIVTKGYDVKTGEVVPLASLPAELPEELPDSDQTGETRALIQNKSTGKEDDIAEGGINSFSNKTATSTTKVSSTTANTLDLRTPSTTTVKAATSTVTDLVVVGQDAATTSVEDAEGATSTAHIPDIHVLGLSTTSATKSEDDN